MPIQEMLKQLKDKYGDKYGWAVISAEDHEERENDTNVGVHRHAMVELKGVINIKNPRWWDLKYEDRVFHPHFEPAKKKAQCLNYVIKDGDYIVDGTYKDVPFSIETYLEANGKKQGYGFTYIATQLKQGKTLDEIDEVIPGHVLNHKRKIEEYQQFLIEKKNRTIARPKFYGFKVPENRSPWDRVAKWANENFLLSRRPRQKQLWLWSREPEMGKSFPWSIILREYYKCYEWITDGKQGKEILECDYILMDELKGGVKVSTLKSLAQMYGMNLDIKYSTITFWNRNVPLIVTSNRPPTEIYRKCDIEEIRSLESRFELIEVTERYYLKPQKPPREESPLSDTTTKLLLGSSQNLAVDSENEERDENEHSEFSNEEFSKMEKLRKKNN